MPAPMGGRNGYEKSAPIKELVPANRQINTKEEEEEEEELVPPH